MRFTLTDDARFVQFGTADRRTIPLCRPATRKEVASVLRGVQNPRATRPTSKVEDEARYALEMAGLLR